MSTFGTLANTYKLLLVFGLVFCQLINPALSLSENNKIAALETGAGNVLPPPIAPAELDGQVPDSDAKHDINKTLNMEKLRLHSAVHLYSFQPIRLEVQNDQPITLEDALNYAVENNLPIKISRENVNYQRFQLYSQVA